MARALNRQARSLTSIDATKPQLLDALNHLSQIQEVPPTDIKEFVRRRNKQNYSLFINKFQGIVDSIYKLEEKQIQLEKVYENLAAQVQVIVHGTGNALRQGKKFYTDLERIGNKQEVLQAVIDCINLNKEEYQILTNINYEVNQEFFNALVKLQKINEYALILDKPESRLLKISLDDYISNAQEAAYEKLFRFVQKQCKILEQDKVELLPGFYDAISHLRKRNLYYKHCREEIINFRRKNLLKRFIFTLEKGPDPLDNQWRDSAHYTGQMLAWIYSALVAEQNLISGLLGEIENIDDEVDNLQQQTVLDKIAEVIVPVFLQKTESTLDNQQYTTCFQLISLYEFYIERITERDLLGFACKLIQSLYTRKTDIEEHLHHAVVNNCRQVCLFGISTDLKSPHIFNEKIKEVKEILQEMSVRPELQKYFPIIYDGLV